ncbi:MAG TPA: CRTAC1 family protein, partial [Candidatus Acidoferrum sp.]|nr:CRTAC1 family protein [Candidatus Acidoferrum sp.]
FVTTVRHGNHLFENLGHGRFHEITTDAGVTYSGHSSSAVFFDFDNDGWLDLFVCNVGVYTTNSVGPGGFYRGLVDAFQGHLIPSRRENSILYHNKGGKQFEDVSAKMGLVDGSWTGDAAFADLNGDGFLDLYVLNMQGDNRYYENQAGKRFIDKTAAHFPKTPWGAMGIKFFDYDQDGAMDLLITDMHSDMTDAQIQVSKTTGTLDFERSKSEAWCTTRWTETYLQGSSNNIFGNALFQNRGKGQFAEVSNEAGVENLWPWGVSVGDLNADGYEDIFITAGMGFGFRYAVNSVLLNEAGKEFVNAEFLLGLEPRAQGRIKKVAFTLDCSGADQSNRLCQGQSGLVPVFEFLSSRSSAMVDLDNDGDLDIITNEMNDRPQVLLSSLAASAKVQFLKIKLAGTKSNRDGLGALVKVRAGGRTFTQLHDGKSGYFGHSSLPLYFGLGNAERAEAVEVVWPSGARQILDSPNVRNGMLVIEEAK